MSLPMSDNNNKSEPSTYNAKWQILDKEIAYTPIEANHHGQAKVEFPMTCSACGKDFISGDIAEVRHDMTSAKHTRCPSPADSRGRIE